MKNRLNTMKLPPPREARQKPQPLTMQQVRALLDAAPEEWKGMILLGLYTGIRIQEIAGLTWDAVDLQHAAIYVRSPKERPRTLPVSPELASYLNSKTRPADPQAPVFPTCSKVAMQNPAKLFAL